MAFQAPMTTQLPNPSAEPRERRDPVEEPQPPNGPRAEGRLEELRIETSEPPPARPPPPRLCGQPSEVCPLN